MRVFFLFSLLSLIGLCGQGYAGDSEQRLTATLTAPAVVPHDRAFRIKVQIKNEGDHLAVFRHHWKWSERTMFIALARGGQEVTRSKPLLFDIPSDQACLWLKPLFPGESFTFETLVNEEAFGTPKLSLPASGRAELSWSYRAEGRYDDCGVVGPSWVGTLHSNSVRIETK